MRLKIYSHFFPRLLEEKDFSENETASNSSSNEP